MGIDELFVGEVLTSPGGTRWRIIAFFGPMVELMEVGLLNCIPMILQQSEVREQRRDAQGVEDGS